MADTISWTATAATILAALMTASNLGSRATGYGLAVFTAGALCEGETLVATLGQAEFERLEKLARDQWPAR